MDRSIAWLLGCLVLAGCADEGGGGPQDPVSASPSMGAGSPSTDVLAPAAQDRSVTFACSISEAVVYGIDSTQAGTDPMSSAEGCPLYDGSPLGFTVGSALLEARVDHGPNATYDWRFRFQWGEETVMQEADQGAIRMHFAEDSPRHAVFGVGAIHAYSEPHVVGAAQDVRAEVALTVFEGSVPEGFSALGEG